MRHPEHAGWYSLGCLEWPPIQEFCLHLLLVEVVLIVSANSGPEKTSLKIRFSLKSKCQNSLQRDDDGVSLCKSRSRETQDGRAH